MTSSADEMKQRTKEFAIRIIKVVESLPNSGTARVLGNQLLRSGTSVGANYRAACRARSATEFRSKLGIAEEEIDESCYWIELIGSSGLHSVARLEPLLAEANEILAILVASIKTSKRNARAR